MPDIITPDPQLPVAPNTTVQQDLIVAGQRKINMVWEVTQSIVAVLVVTANMGVGAYQGVVQTHLEFPMVLSNALFLVVGFYFSRTNHQSIGGVPPNYKGR